MTNNSSTGGYLVSETVTNIDPPIEGQAFLDLLQAQFVGITGIAGTLIRPRWQPNPPILPTTTQDWMAFGITERKTDTNANTYHVSNAAYTPPTFDVVLRSEEVTVLCSVYGPNADLNASLLREGFAVAQNREPLQLKGVSFVGAGSLTPAPALVNEIWYYRVDIPLTFRRWIRREYPVLDIASASGTIETDESLMTRPFTVTQ